MQDEKRDRIRRKGRGCAGRWWLPIVACAWFWGASIAPLTASPAPLPTPDSPAVPLPPPDSPAAPLPTPGFPTLLLTPDSPAVPLSTPDSPAAPLSTPDSPAVPLPPPDSPAAPLPPPDSPAALLPTPDTRVCEPGDLVWSDEFDEDGIPSASRWRYEAGGHGWGNQELQFYTTVRSRNAWVEDGSLIIEARKQPWSGRAYTSARLLSREEWLYGRFEVRAILPSGRGTWPAIWMLPDLSKYGGWPRAGEIDIMEHVGFSPDRVHFTVHTDAYNHQRGTQRGSQIRVPTARSEFNVYAMEWTPSEIRGYVNDRNYFRFRNQRLTNSAADDRQWPFDHPFHFVLNIAVGGTWGGQQGIDPDIWPQRMQIDYVRVYSCADVVRAESDELPQTVQLDQNYPNPFNPATSIRFTLPRTTPVRLAVYDAVGREVALLVDGVRLQGTHTEAFQTPGLPSGMYVYVLSTPETVLTKRMLLVK